MKLLALQYIYTHNNLILLEIVATHKVTYTYFTCRDIFIVPKFQLLVFLLLFHARFLYFKILKCSKVLLHRLFHTVINPPTVPGWICSGAQDTHRLYVSG